MEEQIKGMVRYADGSKGGYYVDTDDYEEARSVLLDQVGVVVALVLVPA
jgi:hypothetical protein